MLAHDGGTKVSDRPVVNLVRFGSVESDLALSLARSVEVFFRYLDVKEDLQPAIRNSHHRLPARVPAQHQGDFLLSHIRGYSGNIVLGITDIAFFDPGLPRNVFGYGSTGRGVLSTFRFRRESENHRILYERLNKEIIKILALACDLTRCRDPTCIVVYHRTMEDIDRNITICPMCRRDFLCMLESYLGGDECG